MIGSPSCCCALNLLPVVQVFIPTCCRCLSNRNCRVSHPHQLCVCPKNLHTFIPP